LFTVVVAVPGMILLWVLWRKGFVVETVRQPSTEDDGHAAPAPS
jgi:PAT family beta-lactamase induction signal transducer AmpG